MMERMVGVRLKVAASHAARRTSVASGQQVPPSWMRKLEAVLLMRAFSRAFDVEAPSLRGIDAQEALCSYRAFTAACLAYASKDERLAAYLRHRLGNEARRLGSLIRALVPGAGLRAIELASYLYRGIGIGLVGTSTGHLCFCPCCFAECYTPEACRLMSAFDEGFLCGLTGRSQASLVFFCRLTEGASCCLAELVEPQVQMRGDV